MNPNLFTVVKVASRNYNVLDESGSPLVDPEGTPLRFLSVGAARAEIEASQTDAEESAAGSCLVCDGPGHVAEDCPHGDGLDPEVPAEAPVVPVAESPDVRAMSRSDRVLAAKAENVALLAWRDAGSDPEARPATPALDALADPSTPRPGRAAAGPKAPDDALISIVREAFTANPASGVSRLYGVARAAGVKASKVTMTAAVDLVRAELAAAS